MPRPRSTQELNEALEHIAYEVWMTAESARGAVRANLQTDFRDTVWQGRKNAYLESMIIHARSMTQFFGGSGRADARHEDSDIVRENFVGVEWTDRPSEAIQYLEGVAKNAHKHVAHLTWERTEIDAPVGWELAIAHHVLELAESWGNAVVRSRPDLDMRRMTLMLALARRAFEDAISRVTGTSSQAGPTGPSSPQGTGLPIGPTGPALPQGLELE